MKTGERRHLLIIGGAQADFGQCLAALFECILQRLHIAALPVGLARGIGQRLQLAGGAAPLVLKQAAGVRVKADDITGQRDFGPRRARFESAGQRDDLETALLFGQCALMVASGLTGAVEQRAERPDQQDDQQQRQRFAGGGTHAGLFHVHMFADSHYPLH